MLKKDMIIKTGMEIINIHEVDIEKQSIRGTVYHITENREYGDDRLISDIKEYNVMHDGSNDPSEASTHVKFLKITVDERNKYDDSRRD